MTLIDTLACLCFTDLDSSRENHGDIFLEKHQMAYESNTDGTFMQSQDICNLCKGKFEHQRSSEGMKYPPRASTSVYILMRRSFKIPPCRQPLDHWFIYAPQRFTTTSSDINNHHLAQNINKHFLNTFLYTKTASVDSVTIMQLCSPCKECWITISKQFLPHLFDIILQSTTF